MRMSFKMKLYPGKKEEYKKRHDNIWPEMVEMLHKYGASNYSIYLDEETNDLIGYVEVENLDKWNESSKDEINQKWQDYMCDIMETEENNNNAKCVMLTEMFHLD